MAPSSLTPELKPHGKIWIGTNLSRFGGLPSKLFGIVLREHSFVGQLLMYGLDQLRGTNDDCWKCINMISMASKSGQSQRPWWWIDRASKCPFQIHRKISTCEEADRERWTTCQQ